MQPVEIEFVSDPDDMTWHGLIESRLLPLARKAGLDDLATFALQLALVEAVNNVIKHAYYNRVGEPISIRGMQSLEALLFELRDRGVPMPQPLPAGHAQATDAPGGRGWQIIRASFPAVSYTRTDGTNVLTLARPTNTAPS
jgi:serine/threonine-protein kinase RsbW